MRRYAILTSVLALAACGGGGGHSGSSSSIVPGDVPPRAAFTSSDAAALSNEEITSMDSEILVDSHGRVTSLPRSGSVNYDGKSYTSYKLDDVVFKLGGEDSRIIFDIDNEGKIVSLGKYDRVDDFTDEPEYGISQEGVFTRTSDDTNEFTKYLYIYGYTLNNDGIDSVAADHFNGTMDIMADSSNLSVDEIQAKIKTSINRRIDKIKASQPDNNNDNALEEARAAYMAQVEGMNSFDSPTAVYAKLIVTGEDIGLKYADLGFAELIVKDSPTSSNNLEHTFTPYVGGYEVLKVIPSEATTFTGTAIAGIDHKKKGYTNNTNVEEGVLVRDDTAVLTVRSDGSSSLEMNNLVVPTGYTQAGQHWYGVKVEKGAGDGTVKSGLPTFTISGENTIVGEKEGVNAYNLPSGVPAAGLVKSFETDDWREHEQEYVISGNDNSRFSGVAETNVYSNGSEMEATSRFSFGNEVHSQDNVEHNEVAIYGAFGGKH